jgi:hypothetical protein
MARSVNNPPTMWKLMKVLSLVCHMRRRRLGPPSRLRPGALEPDIEEMYDAEERLAREVSARRIQNVARSRKARLEVEKRRQKRRQGRNSIVSVDSHHNHHRGKGDDDDSDDDDDDDENEDDLNSMSTFDDSLTMSSSSWYLEPAKSGGDNDEEEEHNDSKPIHMWNANRLTKGLLNWHKNAKHTITGFNFIFLIVCVCVCVCFFFDVVTPVIMWIFMNVSFFFFMSFFLF